LILGGERVFRCGFVLRRRLFLGRRTDGIGVEKDSPVLRDDNGIGLGTDSASGSMSRMRSDGDGGEGISYNLGEGKDHASGVLEGEIGEEEETGDKEDKDKEDVLSTLESVFESARSAERRVSILLGESSL
jgi:hypothetical protein